jgi:hypothetical protein
MSQFVGMKQSRVEARTRWGGLISEQRQSGQSAALFCRERGLPAWAFYAWQKRLREAEAPRFVELEVKPDQATWRSSVRADKAIEIRLRMGLSLFVAPGFEASHLRALLSVLEPEG